MNQNPTLFRHILQLLQDGIPQRLKLIDKALKEKELQKAGKEAHTLKGNTYGALKLQQVLVRFITACKEEKKKEVEKLRKEISKEHRKLKKELNALSLPHQEKE